MSGGGDGGWCSPVVATRVVAIVVVDGRERVVGCSCGCLFPTTLGYHISPTVSNNCLV